MTFYSFVSFHRHWKDISRSPAHCREWGNSESASPGGPQEFLDWLAQQWKQDPSSTPQTSTESFIGHHPKWHPDLVLLSQTPQRHVREEKHQHSVRLLEALQMPSEALFCRLWCERYWVLLRVCQMPTPQLLPDQTHAHNEVLLSSSIDHAHVPVREEFRETLV